MENKRNIEAEDWRNGGAVAGVSWWLLRSPAVRGMDGWNGALGSAALGNLAGLLSYHTWGHCIDNRGMAEDAGF